jgi:alpha-mannosidase
VDANPQFIARYPYRVIGIFGKGWDDIQTTTNEFVTTAINKTNPNRKVIVSNEQDFFIDFEATHGNEISSLTCSFGNEWDLYAAALAEVTADVKRSVEKLRSAEALATLVSLISPNFMSGRDAARSQAWMDMGLYWEHNMGMVNPQYWDPDPITKRIEWQRRLSTEIKSYVNNLQTDSIQALETMIKKSGANVRFFTFNPLGWVRTGAADYRYTGTGPLHVVDLTDGKEVPSQFITISGVRYLRIMASNVPAVGYKVFEIRAGIGQSYPNAAIVKGGTIENTVFRVTVADRGAITSWIDKSRSNREMVRVVNSRAMNDLGPGTGTLKVENAGPVSVTLLAAASSPLAHNSRVTLYRDAEWIDISNEITQNFSSIETWAFGMDLMNPDTWHEEVGAILHAKVLNQGGHYSDQPGAARYDWLTLNHFVDMTGSGPVGVTLSNADCCFMQLGGSTASNLDISTSQVSVLAGGRVANGANGLPNQDGDDYFLQRFALQSHGAYRQAEGMKFAMEHQNPLVTGRVNGSDILPEKNFSLLNINNSNVLLWALKPADDGINHGVIARIWNLSNSASSFNFSFPEGLLAAAQRVTHIETPIEQAAVANGKLADILTAQQMKSYSLDINLPFLPVLPRCMIISEELCTHLPIVGH